MVQTRGSQNTTHGGPPKVHKQIFAARQAHFILFSLSLKSLLELKQTLFGCFYDFVGEEINIISIFANQLWLAIIILNKMKKVCRTTKKDHRLRNTGLDRWFPTGVPRHTRVLHGGVTGPDSFHITRERSLLYKTKGKYHSTVNLQ